MSAHLELIRTLRRNRYDLLICLARSEEGFMLTALSKAVIKAGFTHFPWDLCLDVKETIEGHNCWYNNAKLLRKLDVEITQDNYVGLLPIDGEERTRTLPDRYVVISPRASRRRLIKAWDEEKFAELIILLHAQYALAPLLVGGKDAEECNAICEKAKALGTDVAILTRTNELKDRFREALGIVERREVALRQE